VGRLDHPGIVPIHDVGRSESGDYYFVMKYVDGQTLAQVIDALRRGDPAAHARWSFEHRVQTFHRLLYAVCHAHDRGVVHRDIKPDNVMIGPHGQVQLLDWGVARVRDEPEPELGADTDDDDTVSGGSITHTRAGALIGTPRYMSPEQARGEAVDERADTWALSMVLYEWLTLTHPFDDADGTEALLERVSTGQVPHPRDLPPQPLQGAVPADLGWYVYDGLGPDLEARYPDVQAMLDRLDRRARGDIPVQCPMTLQKSVMHRGQRLLDRHPLAFSIGAALVMALFVLGLAGLAALGVVVLQ
jgi:serine/threonine-protein kinase